jgi:hypothetical protein
MKTHTAAPREMPFHGLFSTKTRATKEKCDKRTIECMCRNQNFTKRTEQILMLVNIS